MREQSPGRPHYPALDGLRGVAILLVVFYHNFAFTPYFFFGWLGVDLFFVLSGFLITDILLKTREQPHFLRNFYIRRVLRIFPLYYLVLFLFLILVPLLGPSLLNLRYFTDHQAWLWTYLQNWLYIFQPPPAHGAALNHLWSLAVEEQFYLLWPLLLLWIRSPRMLAWVMVLLLAAVILLRIYLWVNRVENLVYYNLYTFSRIDGICIGSLLALLRRIHPKAVHKYLGLVVLALALLNFTFYFFNRENRFSYPYLAIAGYTTFAVLFGLLVNEAVSGGRFIITLFNNGLLKFFGKISYSLYVFHWPLYLMLAPRLEKWASSAGGIRPHLLAAAICTLLACLLAWISYRFFESRFLRMKAGFEA